MKPIKILFFSIFISFSISNIQTAKAQNIHLFYDFGSVIYEECKDRAFFTTTVDLFHRDAWGSTFFFIDMNYADHGITYVYWEINRDFTFPRVPISLSLEYNGGLTNTFSLSNSYLAGVRYSYDNEEFTKGVSLTCFYKYIQGNVEPHNFQATAIWYLHFAKKKFSFLGFADFWREPRATIAESDYIFLTEPQIWFNFDALPNVSDKLKLSIGSEVKISYNFVLPDKFMVIPTIALNWRFE